MDIVVRARARRYIVPIIVIATASAAMLAAPADAGGRGKGGSKGSSTGLTLTYEYDNISTFTDLRCYHEDSMHDRLWEGALGPGESFSVTLDFCDYFQDGATPGGTGFMMVATARGVFDLHATSPSHEQQAAHVGYPVKGKEHRVGCVTPPVARTDGVIIGTIEGGDWTVTIDNPSGSKLSNVRFRVLVDMAPRSWQQMWCPAEDRSATS